MNKLQKIFESVIEETFSVKKLGVELIEKKFKQLGITLNQKQLKALASKLENNPEDEIHINVEDDQLLDSTLDLSATNTGNISIELDNIDDLERRVDSFIKDMPELISDIASKISDSFLEIIESNADESLIEFHKYYEEFEGHIKEVWAPALRLLEIFLCITLEFVQDYDEGIEKTTKEDDVVYYVLSRLQARACQIGREVITLLKSGYADGAHARWRTLHEIAVISSFISKHGQEVAERYLNHEIIDTYKAATQYQQYCKALGAEPLSKRELNGIKAEYTSTVKNYGSSFENNYGWATVASDKANPKFTDIERNVGLSHMRPYYKTASYNIHADPKSVFFKLGLLEDSEILLAGPSEIGLASPAHTTAISLLQVTTTFLTYKPNLDSIVACNMLLKLEHEIGESFWQIQSDLESQ